MSENIKPHILLCMSDSNGRYPVPASKGGAVSTLVEHLVALNEQKQLVNMTVVSYHDDKAEKLSLQYPHIQFVWVKVPLVVSWLDALLYWLVTHLTNKKANSFMSLFSLGYYILKASTVVRKGGYDCVVLEHNIPQTWLLRLSGYKGRYFHHLHNLPRVGAKCRSMFERCEKFLCISQYMADDIMRSDSPIGPVCQEQIALLYNCIDTNKFRPMDKNNLTYSRKQFGLSDTDKVIVFAGRITWEKGIDKVLGSLDYIQDPNIKVLVVGAYMMNNDVEDDYSRNLHQLASKHEGKVVFTGYIQQADIPQIYNLADIAVLPSMWEEPAGLTMLEAMACGIPTITTKSGGIPEYVGDSAVVLERDEMLPQNIASSVDKLLSDSELYDNLSKKGIARIRSNFSLDNYLEKFVEIIK